MDRSETLGILGLLADFYPGKFVATERMASAWYMILRDYPLELVQQSVVAFSRENTAFPPNVGQIAAPIDERMAGLPSVSEAVAVVYELASRDRIPGWDELPPYVQPMVEAAGGWHAVRIGDMRELGFAFRTAHKGIVDRRKETKAFGSPAAPGTLGDGESVVDDLTRRMVEGDDDSSPGTADPEEDQ